MHLLAARPGAKVTDFTGNSDFAAVLTRDDFRKLRADWEGGKVGPR